MVQLVCTREKLVLVIEAAKYNTWEQHRNKDIYEASPLM